jgi:hypothetical protein
MSEARLLRKIFGGTTFRGKYEFDYCESCETFTIICPKCENSSCNGGGCNDCMNDPDNQEFCKGKHAVQWYLNEAELETFLKIQLLKKHLEECIQHGFTEINWKWLKDEEHYCEYDKKFFPEHFQ